VAKLDGFSVPRWKREGAAVPEGSYRCSVGHGRGKSQNSRDWLPPRRVPVELGARKKKGKWLTCGAWLTVERRERRLGLGWLVAYHAEEESGPPGKKGRPREGEGTTCARWLACWAEERGRAAWPICRGEERSWAALPLLGRDEEKQGRGMARGCWAFQAKI